ncbi:hypothetical protein [Rhodoplanes sp. Z2-YC6860]|uniref:hypothetical protein n=1 Tax=Rhodoplanes sp. Z2-YC6860 TaxID=674703 RepID=UPI0012EDA307|nr:hypothetical protein [Rhodoplanes sp. Z2-YC6860]
MFPKYRNSFGAIVALHADAAVGGGTNESAYVTLHPALRLDCRVKTNSPTEELTQHLCYRSTQMVFQVIGLKPRLPIKRIHTVRLSVHLMSGFT